MRKKGRDGGEIVVKHKQNLDNSKHDTTAYKQWLHTKHNTKIKYIVVVILNQFAITLRQITFFNKTTIPVRGNKLSPRPPQQSCAPHDAQGLILLT